MWRRIGLFADITLIVLCGSGLFLWSQVEPVPPHPFFAQFEAGRPINIAHQGGERLWPSNTLFAFERAVELGVDVLEMAVHATKDGVLILIHDATVDRTTDGSGEIKEMSLAEIQALDAGHYWTADEGATYPFRGQGIQVPTLESLLRASPHVTMNIEIKPNDADVSRSLCQLLIEYEVTEQVLICSFHDEPLQALRAACPDVATSMTQAEILPFWLLNVVGLTELYQAPAESFQVPESTVLPLLGEVTILTDRFVRNAAAHNVAVHAWTINEVADMERISAYGPHGIITDRPDRLRAVLDR